MDRSVLQKMAELAETPEAVERSTAYVTERMRQFLKKNERVLICFPKKENAACRILEQAIVNCECIPVWLQPDMRWMTMLKTAFTTKCNCIIGPPLMLLGLSKVAKHMGTPLFARNVLMSGYPSTKWMVGGVERGLDCKAWGCFDPGIGAVIAGFSCGNNIGVHIRTEEYEVEIVDGAGKSLPYGEPGNVVLHPKQYPQLRLYTGDQGRLEVTPCSCGCESPRLVDIDRDNGDMQDLTNLCESLHYWSSILDCRAERTECGLELEVVVFQGEKLPKFPSCAKMVIRPWNPETDVPFDHQTQLKNRLLSDFSH